MTEKQDLATLITDIIERTADETSSRIEKAALKNEKAEDDKIFVVKTVAKYLDLKQSTIYALTCRKEIPHYKRGKKLYFKKSEIDKWIETGRVLTNTDLDAIAERVHSKKGGLK